MVIWHSSVKEAERHHDTDCDGVFTSLRMGAAGGKPKGPPSHTCFVRPRVLPKGAKNGHRDRVTAKSRLWLVDGQDSCAGESVLLFRLECRYLVLL